jgi:hypothetical protein
MSFMKHIVQPWKDLIHNAWMLHYARQALAAGDETAAQRWLDRIRELP